MFKRVHRSAAINVSKVDRVRGLEQLTGRLSYRLNCPPEIVVHHLQPKHATIEKIYYQLKQVDVGFKVTTSIDDSWVFGVDAVGKERIRSLIDEIYRYLGGSSYNFV